jgi:dTDP-glucose 4,6-dehydratase
MKKYILLGGGGVFALHTAKFLLEQTETKSVIMVGRNFERSEAYTLGIGYGDSRYRYEQIHILFEQDRLFDLFDYEKPDVIINFAALAHSTSWYKSWRYYETNVTALAKICEKLMSRKYLKRFLQIGTSELYGSTENPATETSELRPSSPYAVSKMAGDLHLISLSKVCNFPMNIIRPSNAYGPGQHLHRILPKAVLCGLTSQKFPLEGEGKTMRSFIHARDLARAIYLICEKAPLGEIYNAGPSKPISNHDLIKEVCSQFKIDMNDFCIITDGRMGEDHSYWLDSSFIKNQLGWEQEIGIVEGVGDMINWGRKYLELINKDKITFTLHA